MPAVPPAETQTNTASDQVLSVLHRRIGTQKFNAWFKQGSRLSVENGHVHVLVPNAFVGHWIEAHYHEDIRAAAEGVARPAAVTISIDPSLSNRLRRGQLDRQADLVTKAAEGRTRPRRPPTAPRLRHRLEDFVVGPSNLLAYTAAQSMIEGNAAFNPLFIHGACGVGKTHLLQGVCNAIAARGDGRSLRWRYVTGEQFTNEYIAAIRKRTLEEFRRRYRDLDVLAIDDVHFLAAKKATQEEFLHTYNSIESAGHRVVMASDAHPRLVGELNEQLVSRFVSGMVVKIDPPRRETRIAILLRRARAMKCKAPKAVLEYIALHIRGSVRELEGALIKLAALAELEGGPMTLEVARAALSEHLARTDSAITLGDIEAKVAAFFGVTPADIHSSRRTRTVSVARMTAMYLARRHTRMSYPEIVLAVQRMEKALQSGGALGWAAPGGPRHAPAAEVVAILEAEIS